MTATFLVTLEVDDAFELPMLAQDIEETLLADGLNITEVKPWARPSLLSTGQLGSQTVNMAFNQKPNQNQNQ